MAVDLNLAEQGRDLPLVGVVQQGRLSTELARQYEQPLQEVGFTPADTQELADCVVVLESSKAAAAEARDTARLQTASEKAALAEAKAFKRKLDLKLRRYFRQPGEKPVTKDAFEAGGTLGKSTPKVSQYLATIREKLVLVDAALAPLFGGKSAVAILDGIKAKLDGAQAKQELAKLNLPEETLKVYEAKGRVYQLLQELVDAGRDAFDGEAEIAAKFNKDLLLAAVRHRPEAETPAAPLQPTG